MSIWNYVVTAHKPTNVTHSCVGNFTGPQDLNLIVAYILFPSSLRVLLLFHYLFSISWFIFQFHSVNVHESRFTCFLLMVCRYTIYFSFYFRIFILDLLFYSLDSVTLLVFELNHFRIIYCCSCYFHVLFWRLCNRVGLMWISSVAVCVGCSIIWKNRYSRAFSPSCENDKNIFVSSMLYNILVLFSIKSLHGFFLCLIVCVSNRVKHRIYCSLLLKDINSAFFNGIPKLPSLLHGMHKKT